MTTLSTVELQTRIMNHLSWPTLESRQTFLKLLLFYKIENKLVEHP